MKNPVKFGKYYLLERISVGGMAEVFKAKSFGEAGFERLVAVKRILPSIAEDQEFIAMFVDEAKLAVQLTHPNIAQIFELGKVGEAYFIALEYVGGKDMRAIFERARKRTETIPIPMACYMVMKLCEGLDYAHNKKDAAGRSLELVHRDVSPQNILVSYDGDVKLIDFGIAKAASKSSKTQAGILKGKFGYMSPEQVRGLGIDRRSDVFAVGICLYELLTMERLFVGESDFSTLEKVRKVEVTPPSAYNRKIPEELEAIVLKALAPHPEDRYRTSMDLHDDLQSFMYTSGNFFARKDLSAYMGKLFAEEIAKEASRDDEFRKFDSRRASDLEVLEGSSAAPQSVAQGRQAPPLPAVKGPPPPPPLGKVNRATAMGVGAPQVNGRHNPPPPSAHLNGNGRASGAQAVVAVATPAQAQAMDMEWDDEELATQVYDKPEGTPSVPPPAPAVPAVMASPPISHVPPRVSVSTPRITGSLPVVPALPVVPPIPGVPAVHSSRPPAPNPALIPPPGSNVAVAPMVATSLQPVTASALAAPPPGPGAYLSGPAVSAPGSPPATTNLNPVPNPASNGATHVGMNPAAAFGAIPTAPGFGQGNLAPTPVANLPKAQPSLPGAHRGNGMAKPDWPAGSVTQAVPRRRDNNSVAMLAFMGVIAVAAAVVLGLKLTRGEPMGALQITTNVGGVVVLVDEQPQLGNGQSFTVQSLSASRLHHVVVRKPGFRTYQQDVPVSEGQVAHMQVVLDPEAPAATALVPSYPLPTPALPTPTQPLVPGATALVPGSVALPTAQPLTPPPAAPVPGTLTVPSQPLLLPTSPAQPLLGATPPPAPVVAAAPRPSGPRSPRVNRPSSLNHPPTPTTPVASLSQARNSEPSGGGSTGTLRLSTRPSTQCTINGQTVSTPRILQLPAGSHRVTCVNRDLGAQSSWTVTIRAGESTSDINHPLE